jgi:signal transduction histidine kinase
MSRDSMKRLTPQLRGTSIRTRLMLAYVGLLLLGFAALTLIAGSQIAQAARADYEQRLLNDVQLVRQGLNALITSDTASSNDLITLINEYEAHLNGTIKLYDTDDDDDGHDRPDPNRGGFREMPEMETAIRDGTVVVERIDDRGRPALYTAATLGTSPKDGHPFGIVQLSVPLDNLQALIGQRWLLLLSVFIVVLSVTVIAALLMARSIIRPLYSLREAALQLARGDLNHRVASPGADEIGDVARAFNQMAKRVQAMIEEQRAYASNASHELRTPLTTIRLRSEALRYDEDLEQELLRQYVREIDEEAQRMSGLIDDLTLLSRFDAGHAERGHDQIDLRQFANSLYQRFRSQLEAQQLTLTLDIPADLPPITGSLNHLTVVFRNLIDNAIKYTPQGGAITWHMMDEGEGVRHIIQDTGQGVDADQLPHLFERFYRADKAHSRDIPGHGLGLAIVKSIVEMYGGTIEMTSAGKNKGTTVTLFLPRAPQHP